VQVQTILAHPVSAQHPDLIHFRPPPDGLAGPSDTSPPAVLVSAGPADHWLPIVVTVAALALAAVCVLGVFRTQRGRWSLRRHLAQIAAPLAGAVVVASAAWMAALLGALWAPPPVAASPAPAAQHTSAASTMSALRSHSFALPVGEASRMWTSLVAIETQLSAQHDQLVSDEQQITAVTSQISEVATTPTADTWRPSYPGVLKTSLQQLVADHQTVLSSYNTSLQREYQFFVAAAKAPDTMSQLTSVAAHTPQDVQQAITTNLALVQTQLQQEAQIAAAATAQTAQLEAAGAAIADLSGPAPALDAPISGVLTQSFGDTPFPLEPPITYNGVFYPHFHTGLDLAAPLDTPVHAAAAGKVILAASSVDAQGNLTGYGNFVMIAHDDGYNTLYAHLDKIQVTVGQTLQQGDVLGLLGSTGWSTGPHVHFEVRKGSVYVDPAPYLGSQIKPQ
jgi:murein DD-endopeptidase MepM/ murein hydrolase activator NlpD